MDVAADRSMHLGLSDAAGVFCGDALVDNIFNPGDSTRRLRADCATDHWFCTKTETGYALIQ